MRRAAVLQIATFCLLVATIIVTAAISTWQRNDIRRLARQGEQAHAALCAFKSDLADRVSRREAFLKTHPEGSADTSASDLTAILVNQRATLESLDGLDCPGMEGK